MSVRDPKLSMSRLFLLRWPRGVAITICGLLGTLLPATFGMINGIREPVGHDEFSYLLAADTFAHGRLTNPTPKLSEFFEAPHILVVPTYNSKYPPGQGMALALGQVVGGHPIAGVWLSCGLFAASLCWMLQAWTSRQWALGVTVLAIINLGVSSYWAQTYWGGMVAACGGALLFGAMRRTLHAPNAMSSVLMALGVLTLANSRPYEGLLACLPAAVVLGWWLIADRQVTHCAKLRSWAAPFCAVLLIGATAMTTYDRAVTGEWLRMPYTVHTSQYYHRGSFLFSSSHQPERNPAPRVTWFYDLYQSTHETVRGWLGEAATNLYLQLPATVESAVTVAAWTDYRSTPYRGIRGMVLLWAFVLVMLLADRWVWFCIVTILGVVLGGSLVWWWFPHYSAPIAPLLLAATALTLRRSTRRAPAAVRKMAPACLALVAGPVIWVLAPNDLSLAPGFGTVDMTQASHISAPAPGPELSRSDVKHRLERQAGSHLVFVRYDENYSVIDEWVYNSADLNAARVIFAHDMGGPRNSELIAAYPGRSVWIVTLSSQERQLQPYSNLTPFTDTQSKLSSGT